MEAVFATKNNGKLKEIIEILSPLRIVSMSDCGIDAEIEENGKTFEENAVLKAKTVASLCSRLVLADDSGLEIDCLNGEPGVRSARFMGEDTPYMLKNARILEMMNDVPFEKRSARFVCAIAAVFPDGGSHVTKAALEGYIAYEPKGANGFGYDPIFFLPRFNATTAELAPECKNEISHRGMALRMMKEALVERGVI